MFNFFSTEENTKDEKQTFDKDILIFFIFDIFFRAKKIEHQICIFNVVFPHQQFGLNFMKSCVWC